MADTRRANPELQLDVDELMLEYLVYNTLTACIKDWNPGYRHESGGDRNGDDTASKARAPTLLAILDTTVHLFKINHPGHPFSKNTAFYFKLLEFLLLFSHKRGGSSVLSKASYSFARDAGEQNIKRRARCLLAKAKLVQSLSDGEERLLAAQYVEASRSLPIEGSQSTFHRDAGREVPLVDLLPLFMELSAEIVDLTQTDVSSVWLQLACEFMTQAGIEVVLQATTSSEWTEVDRHTLTACFGWGPPINMSDFSLIMEIEESSVADTEKKIHHMLRSTGDNPDSQTPSWDEESSHAINEFKLNMDQRYDESEVAGWYANNKRKQIIELQVNHPVQRFEVQILHYMENLQKVWAQLNEEPVLLQIEQGRLQGLNGEGFQDFMDRVGSDEHEANLERIEIPAVSKI